MSGFVSMLLGIVVLVVLLGGFSLLLWLLLGRKKKGDQKMIGTLEQSAIIKGGAPSSAPPFGRFGR